MISESIKINDDNILDIINDIDFLVNKYGWGERLIHPYSFGIKVKDFIDAMKDYDNYTYYSKGLARDEIKGLIPIINEWERLELTSINVIWNGTTRRVSRDVYNILLELGENIEIIEGAE